MSKSKVLILAIALLVVALFCVGCDTSSNETATKTEDSQVSMDLKDNDKSSDLKREISYEKIKADFLQLTDDPTVENIDKITGITGILTDEGGIGSDIWEWVYSDDPNVRITAAYDTTNPITTLKIELPDEGYMNPDLDLSGVTEEQFKAALESGITVQDINDMAGGAGVPNRWEFNTETGKAHAFNYKWVDAKHNSIAATLNLVGARGGAQDVFSAWYALEN